MPNSSNELLRCWYSPIPLKEGEKREGLSLPQVSRNDLNNVIGALECGSRQLMEISLDDLSDILARWAQSLAADVSKTSRGILPLVVSRMGLSMQGVQEVLLHTFRSLSKETILSLAEKFGIAESGKRADPDRKGAFSRTIGPQWCFLILPANVPGVGIWDLVFCLLCRSAVLAKPSVREPLLLTWAAKRLGALHPALSSSVAVLPWSSDRNDVTMTALGAAPAIVVYGTDRTIGFVQRNSNPDSLIVKRGPRFSVALFTREGVTGINASLLAKDMVLLDQRGCLSPSVCFVEGEEQADQLVPYLSAALSSFSREYPAVLSLDYRSAYTQVRLAALACDGRVFGNPTEGWLIVLWKRESDQWSRYFTPVRALHLIPVSQLDDALAMLTKWGSKIQAVAVAGNGHRLNRLMTCFARLGVSRVCSVGSLHFPPLDWEQDGRHLMRQLLQRCNAEEIVGIGEEASWEEVYRGADEDAHRLRAVLEYYGIPYTLTSSADLDHPGLIRACILVPSSYLKEVRRVLTILQQKD